MGEGLEVMDKLRALLGTTTGPVINEVEKGAIKRYAEAVDDPNPLYSDLEYASKTKYQEIICPPGFFGWAKKVNDESVEMMSKVFGTLIEAGLLRILDGGVEYDFYLPVRAGDTLTWYAKFADAKERVGKEGGRMVFITMELTFINQNGDLVAKRRQTFLAR
jgi:acyl dehydratase